MERTYTFKQPFNISVEDGDNVKQVEILTAEVGDLSFLDYLDIVITHGGPKKEPVVFRERVAAQTRFFNADKKLQPVTTDQMVRGMSFQDASHLRTMVDDTVGTQGKVLDGDVLNTPCIYKLGDPLQLQVNGKAAVVTELEFSVATWADGEALLTAANDMHAVKSLILDNCKPLGVDMVGFPVMLAKQITIADGMTILEKVLPSF